MSRVCKAVVTFIAFLSFLGVGVVILEYLKRNTSGRTGEQLQTPSSINGHAEGTSTTASSDVWCHINMDNPQDCTDGKDCRVTLTVGSKQLTPSCYNMTKRLITFPRGKTTCCKVASKCNDENYCGHGEMKCLYRNGTESPECVCNRGWHGLRCDMCSPKVKMSCSCSSTNLQNINEMACSSSEAGPNRRCWIHHKINDQNLTCVCVPAIDGHAFNADTRCSGDRTVLCEDIEDDDKRRLGEGQQDKSQSQAETEYSNGKRKNKKLILLPFIALLHIYFKSTFITI